MDLKFVALATVVGGGVLAGCGPSAAVQLRFGENTYEGIKDRNPTVYAAVEAKCPKVPYAPYKEGDMCTAKVTGLEKSLGEHGCLAKLFFAGQNKVNQSFSYVDGKFTPKMREGRTDIGNVFIIGERNLWCDHLDVLEDNCFNQYKGSPILQTWALDLDC